jgi:hypothetical protein
MKKKKVKSEKLCSLTFSENYSTHHPWSPQSASRNELIVECIKLSLLIIKI